MGSARVTACSETRGLTSSPNVGGPRSARSNAMVKLTDHSKSRSTIVFQNKVENEEVSVFEYGGEIHLMVTGPYEQNTMFCVTPADLINMGSALLNLGRRLLE